MVMAPGGNLGGNQPGSLAPADPRVTGEPTSGTLLFLPDGTYDIGATGAKPRNIYAQNDVIPGGALRFLSGGYWYNPQPFGINAVQTNLAIAFTGQAAPGGTVLMMGGSGAPSAGVGSDGMFYFRTDTPGVANQRIYIRSGGAWVGIV